MESDRSPSRSTITNRNGGNAFTEYSTLTVRDYFAASISPFLFQHCWTNGGPEWEKSLSEMAYRVSDAMLREREKQK